MTYPPFRWKNGSEDVDCGVWCDLSPRGGGEEDERNGVMEGKEGLYYDMWSRTTKGGVGGDSIIIDVAARPIF